MKKIITHYSAWDIEARILVALKEAGLDTEQQISPMELAALDHFHTGGFEASLVLLELAQIQSEHRILDIGSGLAGPARMLAAMSGCHVDCIDLSSDFCKAAVLLNRLTGLEDLIQIYRGSVPDSPFADNSFDVAWMQNVGMNIKDKQKFYTEIRRVLKPGGRFVFQEMIAGEEEPSYFPLPWTTDSSGHFLINADTMQQLLSECGFIEEYFEDVSESQFSSFKPADHAQANQTRLSLSIYVDDLATKGKNSQRSLLKEQILFYRGVFTAV